MIIAIFIIAVVVSMPIVAVVLVSMASRREEMAWSLGDPAPGAVQAAARRIVDFHTDCPGELIRPAGQDRARARTVRPISIAAANRPVDVEPRPVLTPKMSVGQAA